MQEFIGNLERDDSCNLDLTNPNPSICLGKASSNIVKQMKSCDFTLICIILLLLKTCLNFIVTFRNPFGMLNEVFSHNFDLANPYPSSFLGNVSRNISQQMKNCALHIVLHNTIVTENLFEFFVTK